MALAFCRPALLRSRLCIRRLTTDSVTKETQDVSSMDNLLNVVRLRADPAYNTVIPMRVPQMWSEAVMAHSFVSKSPPPPQDTNEPLIPRNMHDSYCELVLPFGSSPKILEQYTNVHGGIRTGKLMEHLDSLAGSISYKHMLGPSVQSLGKIEDRGFYIVTASVDRLDMLSQLDPSRDLRLSGQVIYTGKSSMEVAVKMETIGMGKEEETVLLGRFSMVCRDAVTHLARTVNPLLKSTPEEEALYAMGEEMKKRRQSMALRSLSRVPPSSQEAEALHTFYLNHGQEINSDKYERVWMGDTKLEKCMLMFPQERNVHQKIFGGYLMRMAYELGFSNSSLFMRGGHVRFLSLDGIAFAQPVPIGSILRLTSNVLHSTSSKEFPIIVHVGVTANVVDVKTGNERTTNEFRFTWCRDDALASSVTRKVVPRTYKEAMLWLEGGRALAVSDEIRGLRMNLK
ncbi:Thioesterase/thiol ester dehydrase-isomerase [Roridomyces roridus]|uniref:Thioesterase/thiol ester dehydrase-isomerase n=1 Tax=Roridomyces roridus TaxID=1738132 RepID=A0AAD7BF30_9AGAR|nr:Thioesterase/thiol ester dehydrase-isomerase [Roridomyces roridus]